jgi:hypothetical protein
MHTETMYLTVGAPLRAACLPVLHAFKYQNHNHLDFRIRINPFYYNEAATAIHLKKLAAVLVPAS